MFIEIPDEEAERHMIVHPNETMAAEASCEGLKRIHSIKEREDLKKENEEAIWVLSSRNIDFIKTWANLKIWTEKLFGVLKKGVAFRVEIHFDPEADIAEINIYEKIAGKGATGKSLESSKVEVNL